MLKLILLLLLLFVALLLTPVIIINLWPSQKVRVKNMIQAIDGYFV